MRMTLSCRSLRSFARLDPIETEADTLRAAARLFLLGNLCGRQPRIDLLEEGLAFRVDEFAVRGQRRRRNLHVRRSRFEATLLTRTAVEVMRDGLTDVAQHASGAREGGSVDGVEPVVAPQHSHCVVRHARGSSALELAENRAG